MSRDHQHEHDPRSPKIRTEALENLLVERGLVSERSIDRIIEQYENDIGPLRGAQVVARAWNDRDYRDRLLADGTTAVGELGFEGVQMERLVVKENTTELHNVVCCTLCSCYPWAVLGLPPNWYKDASYRARIVREPRQVLAEMGLELAPSVRIQVWDSSAEIRYLVLPRRPAGTEAWNEQQLATLVSRDSMIGVAAIASPT